jgi:hypothetical protein
MRMKPNRFSYARIRDTLPWTVFLRMFWPLLTANGATPRLTQRHYGAYTSPTFSYTVCGEIPLLDDLVQLFGDAVLSERTWQDGGLYNSDPTVGPLAGGVMRVSREHPVILRVRAMLYLSILF